VVGTLAGIRLTGGGEPAPGRGDDVTRNLICSVTAAMACLLAVTSCGRTTGPASPTVAAPACPPRAPAAEAPRGAAASSGPGGLAALVRTGAVVVAICQYGPHLPSSKASATPARRVVLHGAAADGLAVVIDSAGPATGYARRCARPAGLLPFSQALIFAYRAAPTEAVAVSYTQCSLAVVAGGARLGVLPDPVQSDLFFYTTITGHERGPRTPRLIGLGVRAAAGVASRRDFGLYVDGAAIDTAAAAGTVIFQVLPAGTPDAGPGLQVGIVLAVRPAPACAPRQLALSYLAGGAGAGNDFGAVLVSDASGRACTLSGPLRLTGLDLAGHPVTRSISFPVTGVAVLSPGAGPVSPRVAVAGSPAAAARGAFVGTLSLAAEYRDGPVSVDNGYCAPLWIVPATWRLVLPGGQALTVPNIDRTGTGKLVPSGGLVTCRGQLGGLLPATVSWHG
jgi:hypothetical protein